MRGLSLAAVVKFDKSGMLGILRDFPLQCRIALDLATKVSRLCEKRDFKNIVFAGVGGSAIGSDLVRSYLYFESKLPIQVVREYDLPAYADSSTLVFISSYSGNTEEILDIYAQARSRGAGIIAISSNGSLKENCLKNGVTFVGIPAGIPPRCSIGYSSIIPLCLLAKLGLAPDNSRDIEKMIAVLEELECRRLNPGVAVKDNIAKYAATRLFNKFPVVYAASTYFGAVALRLRGQLNENSKSLALSNVFPEMNHNEIVGWQHPRGISEEAAVLLLRDNGQHRRVTKRMDITRDIFREKGVSVTEIYSQGEELLSRMFSLVYTGDFISFYLAALYGTDPTPVEQLDYLKKELKERPDR